MSDSEYSDVHKQRLEQKSVVTSRLSETSRFLAFGVIAWVFAVQSSDAKFSISYVAAFEVWVNVAGALAVVSIACDYFQYLSAYFSVKHALTRKEYAYRYNKNHPAYLLQFLFFVVKQVTVGISAFMVASTFALHIILY